MGQARSARLFFSPIIAATMFVLMFVVFMPLSGMDDAPVAKAQPATETVYPFLEFDEPRSLHELDQPSFFNEFYGGGSFDGCCSDTSQLVTTRDEATFVGEHGASLRLAYTLSTNMPEFGSVAYAQSVFGDPFQDRFALNLDDIFGELTDAPVGLERFEFYVRGSGATSNIHTIRLQFKDRDDEGVWRNFTIDDSNTTWTKITVPLDFSSAQGWNDADFEPDTIDRTRMKQVSFLIQRGDNPQDFGVWYLDHAAFVDEDLAPLTLDNSTDDQFLELVSKRSFQYFLDWYDWDSGMWESRSVDHGRASIGLVGFGLSAIVIGAERGWISDLYARDIVTNTLTKVRDGQTAGSSPSAAIDQNGYRGFYWHFVDIGTGGPANRAGTSELSSVDTALGMMGVVHARQHYSDDVEIVTLADEILGRVEWKWFLDSSRENNTIDGDTIAPANQTYLAWAPECSPDFSIFANEVDAADGCFSPFRWDYTTDEVMLINLLGISSPNPDNQVNTDTFYAWQRSPGNYGGFDVVRTFFGSLFTYFFAQEWVDWGLLGTDTHPNPALRVNWEVNAQNAARANHAFVADQYALSPGAYPAYAPPRWGLTVSDGAAERVACGNETSPRQYCNFGAPPLGLGATVQTPEGTPIHDGTLQPYGSASMMHLVPDIALPSVKSFYSDTLIWRERFGFGDALNLNPQKNHANDVVPHPGEPFYNYVLYDVDNSPILLGIDNYRDGSTRHEIMSYPPFREGLCRLFLNTEYCVAPIHVEVFEDLDQSGTRDAGEDGLAEWEVTAGVRLTQTNPMTVEVSATTGDTGQADFQTYSNGEVEVCLTLKPDWAATTPTCQTIVVQEDIEFTVRFGAFTVEEDTSAISIAPLDADKAEGNGGATSFTFTVSRVGGISNTVSVSYTVSGIATGDDFAGGVLPVGTIEMGAGEASQTLTLDVQGNAVVELDEPFTVTLSNPSPNATIATAAAVGTLRNDDSASLTIGDASDFEGNSGTTPFTLTVTLNGAVDVPVSVDFATSDGSAQADSDYQSATGTRNFTGNDGEAQNIVVQVNGDLDLEDDETFDVNLDNVQAQGRAVTLDEDGGSATIVNDDNVLSIAALDADKLEGNSGTITFTFVVSRNGYLDTEISAHYSVSGNVDGDDFGGGVVPSGTVNLVNGAAAAALTLDVQGDLQLEADEPFTVTLSNPSLNTSIAAASAVGTIRNDDGLAALDVSKRASVALARVGEEVIYTYIITNSGELNFTTLDAIDEPLGSVLLEASSLAPGESTSGQLTHTVTLDDLPGPLQNTMTVSGTPVVGNAVVVTAEASVELVNVAFDFTKTVGIEGIEPECSANSPIQVPVSTTIVYCFSIHNTGTETLTTHTLVDSHLGTLLDGEGFDVAPDATFTFTTTRQIFATVTNTATWTAGYTGSDTVNIAALPAQANTEATVIISGATADQDEDGIPDNIEQATDQEADNIPNFLDDDSDGDGRLDSDECPSLPCRDFDGDGDPDFLDLDNPTALDPDEQPAASEWLFLPSIGDEN